MRRWLALADVRKGGMRKKVTLIFAIPSLALRRKLKQHSFHQLTRDGVEVVDKRR